MFPLWSLTMDLCCFCRFSTIFVRFRSQWQAKSPWGFVQAKTRRRCWCGTYVAHMWHICGTGIKTSGENTLAPSNFVHLVHGVQSGWKMKIDGLVRLSKGWFQDNPCHSIFIVLTSCLNFAVCSPAVRRLPWWRRGQDDLMPRSSMQQQCN